MKLFPKSRLCVIDCYPAFKDGLKKAIQFAKKHNITLNSSDGKKIILSFCIKDIENFYKNTKSPYPIVLYISSQKHNKKIENFINNHFDYVMQKLPAPYCGKHDLNSPDLEAAAESCLRSEKPKHKFQEFLKRLSIREVK